MQKLIVFISVCLFSVTFAAQCPVLEICSKGQYRVGSDCANCIPGCTDCTNQTECTTDGCFPGFIFNATNYNCTADPSYTCTEGQYFDSNENVCKDCELGCARCNATACQMCSLNNLYLRNELTCKYFCRKRCVPGEKGCLECNDDAGGQDICASCQNNYLFNGFQQECQRLTAQDLCTPQEDFKYYLGENATGCALCGSTCDQCDMTAENCTSCKTSQGDLQDNKCVLPDNPSDSSSSSKLWMYLVGAMFIIVLFVAIYYICKKEDEEDDNEYQIEVSDTERQKQTLMH